MCRVDFWTLRERERVGWFGRMALKHVYYHVRNESPVYVQCRMQDAWGWCTGMIRKDDVGWEVGGEFMFGNSCTLVVDSCQCMAKPTQYCKVKINNNNNNKKQWYHFANKGPYSQTYGFSSSYVWMWELDQKEGWAPKNWCFPPMVLEKTWESLGLQGDQTN